LELNYLLDYIIGVICMVYHCQYHNVYGAYRSMKIRSKLVLSNMQMLIG